MSAAAGASDVSFGDMLRAAPEVRIEKFHQRPDGAFADAELSPVVEHAHERNQVPSVAAADVESGSEPLLALL
jgi:hypothetical protein